LTGFSTHIELPFSSPAGSLRVFSVFGLLSPPSAGPFLFDSGHACAQRMAISLLTGVSSFLFPG